MCGVDESMYVNCKLGLCISVLCFLQFGIMCWVFREHLDVCRLNLSLASVRMKFWCVQCKTDGHVYYKNKWSLHWPQIIFGIFLDFFPRPLLTTGKIFNIALCADEMPQLVKISLYGRIVLFLGYSCFV